MRLLGSGCTLFVHVPRLRVNFLRPATTAYRDGASDQDSDHCATVQEDDSGLYVRAQQRDENHGGEEETCVVQYETMIIADHPRNAKIVIIH